MQAVTISELIAARLAAKRTEDAAVLARREIDEQISNHLRDPAKVEGTVTEKAGDFKISVVYKLTRKVDADELRKTWDKLTPDQQGAFKWAADVSTTNLRKLEDADRAVVSKLITTKPASPTISIEAV